MKDTTSCNPFDRELYTKVFHNIKIKTVIPIIVKDKAKYVKYACTTCTMSSALTDLCKQYYQFLPIYYYLLFFFNY